MGLPHQLPADLGFGEAGAPPGCTKQALGPEQGRPDTETLRKGLHRLPQLQGLANNHYTQVSEVLLNFQDL